MPSVASSEIPFPNYSEIYSTLNMFYLEQNIEVDEGFLPIKNRIFQRGIGTGFQLHWTLSTFLSRKKFINTPHSERQNFTTVFSWVEIINKVGR